MRWLWVPIICVLFGVSDAAAAVVIVEKGTAHIRADVAFKRVYGSADVRSGDIVRVTQGSEVFIEYAEGCKVSLPRGDTLISDDLCHEREQLAYGKHFNNIGADNSLLSTLAPPYAEEAYLFLEETSGRLYTVVAAELRALAVRAEKGR